MEYQEYQRRVIHRASHRWHSELMDIQDLKDTLEAFIEAGNRLDRVKKTLMYGRPFYMDTPGDCEELVAVGPVPIIEPRDQRLVHAMLGIATEGVEMMEAVYEFFFGEKNPGHFDLVNLQEEFGDVEWYRAFGLVDLGQTHEENIEQNDTKLEKRFGSTFSEEKANERDLEGERAALERRTCEGLEKDC